MSIQPFIDPHVGRCKNIRPSNDGERDTSRRCVEMDGHRSACRFPPEQRHFHDVYPNFHSSSQQPPTPWVVPKATDAPRTDNVECRTCDDEGRLVNLGRFGDMYCDCPDCTPPDNVDGLAPHDEHDGDDDGCDGDDPDGVHTVVLPTGPSS